MKISKFRFSTWLFWITVVSMAAYIGYFGYWLMKGQPKIHGQTLLLVEVFIGIIIASLPFLIEKLGRFYFPQIELIFFYIFLYMSIFLGSGLQFYGVPFWDKYEHVFSAMMLAGLGFSIFQGLMTARDNATNKPFLMSLFAFTFGTTCGVFWEMYEFTADGLGGLNLQRYEEAGKLLVGRAALMDTMTDLIADLAGAFLMALIGYLMMKHDPSSSRYLVFKTKRQNFFSSYYF
ncbi:hypothetical protein [Lentilactobacillus parakefiri]|uniref:Uncharacterized protein n=1 Tax=Lentilactobacillus parakefiri TaxID=152332 RepID=A0A269XV91_9LACO|nr:hypothetical protein [Lentilactobacillus parakefiri]PAK77227.1 hypothetical protein B8W98_11255 [Lentilactobacillus parakefiri]PAL00960.1 hypothetical protein B8W96_04080 [Lentilactobacillus parakefiri]TDG95241.1 hypothetical protein C5L28_001415 [Lentilactobacillus parakefiri]GAW72231.1 hypothetical protein LPKJCM_01342 [Lentilactobacillus parakefiri]